MLDLERINGIHQKGVEKNWPFHYVFNSLKSIGVERVEVNVLIHETKYVGGGASVTEKAPAELASLTPSTVFNLDMLKEAIARFEKRELNPAEFRAQIAGAGVTFYRIDMLPRTVTYHGPRRDKHVEKVPE